jgi:O-antigen ligase
MSPLDAFWHLANLFAPAWGVAALLAGAIKLVWRREAAGQRWMRLWGWGAAGGAVAVVISLALLGRDGKMAGYALLLLGVALPQWWLLSFRR